MARPIAGDRVQVKIRTARPFFVTLDNEDEPFDLIALHESEFTPLADEASR